jgi:hypothetical protein
MSSGTASHDAIVKLERALPDLANGAHSLAEIEAWIRAQPCVRSVQLADYLLKSNPPQRDFHHRLCGTRMVHRCGGFSTSSSWAGRSSGSTVCATRSAGIPSARTIGA